MVYDTQITIVIGVINQYIYIYIWGAYIVEISPFQDYDIELPTICKVDNIRTLRLFKLA